VRLREDWKDWRFLIHWHVQSENNARKRWYFVYLWPCMYRNMCIPGVCQSSVYHYILQKFSAHLGTFLQLGPSSLWWYGYQPALQQVLQILIPLCIYPVARFNYYFSNATIVNIPIYSLCTLPRCFPIQPLLFPRHVNFKAFLNPPLACCTCHSFTGAPSHIIFSIPVGPSQLMQWYNASQQQQSPTRCYPFSHCECSDWTSGVQKLLTQLAEKLLQRFGHVKRMDRTRISRRALKLKFKGKRPM
jgi:hypothetical protein